MRWNAGSNIKSSWPDHIHVIFYKFEMTTSNKLCKETSWANSQSLIDWHVLSFFKLWKDEYVYKLQNAMWVRNLLQFLSMLLWFISETCLMESHNMRTPMDQTLKTLHKSLCQLYLRTQVCNYMTYFIWDWTPWAKEINTVVDLQDFDSQQW